MSSGKKAKKAGKEAKVETAESAGNEAAAPANGTLNTRIMRASSQGFMSSWSSCSNGPFTSGRKSASSSRGGTAPAKAA